MKPRPLTAKQSAWLAAFLVNGFNATQAARTAGYKGNAKTLAQVGSENLIKPDIASRVEKVIGAALEKAQISVERLTVELGYLALSDIRELVSWTADEGHSLTDSGELSDAAARSIKDVRISKRAVTIDGVETTYTDIDLKLHGKREAAVELLKIAGAYPSTRFEHTGPGGGPIEHADAIGNLAEIMRDPKHRKEVLSLARVVESLPLGDGSKT
mgnify:CR=1 FL=1